jgi:ABC-type glycerol-3-phosphate transport system substrate-binding protein
LQFFTDYSNPKNSVYSWNISLPSSKESFLAETLATYFGFGSEYSDIQEKNPNLNFDVAMVPQTADATAKVTFGELYGFAILKTSPNISQALNTLLTLVSANSVSEFLQLDYVAPARKDLLSAGSQDPIKTVIYNSALISKGWIDPDYQKTSQIFQDMVENVTTGRDTVEDSVSNASDQLNSLFLQ